MKAVEVVLQCSFIDVLTAMSQVSKFDFVLARNLAAENIPENPRFLRFFEVT